MSSVPKISECRVVLQRLENKPFCEVCGRCFAQRSTLNRHRRVHTQEKRFHCQVCKKRFTRLEAVEAHHFVHSGEKPYACKVCELRYRFRKNLTRHEKTHRGFTVTCEECNMRFASSSCLKSHLYKHAGVKPFACVLCGVKFRSKEELKVHGRVHTRVKPYVCIVCNARFTTSSQRIVHERRHHDGVKPYCCSDSVCKQTFSTSRDLVRHLKKVH